MKFIKLLSVFIVITAFLTACGAIQTDETSQTVQDSNRDVERLAENDGDYWARDNFDLQRVGKILDESKDAKDFEYRLNSDDGINNLDLNGDGYVDYISVSEYDDRYDDQRGFSLFSKFGANDIQELASIIFDRDRPDRRGAKIYINGNDQIYGDNNFYEQNWLDKSLNIADWVFGDRDNYYRSPYYYDNYPENYAVYKVVETPVYRTRVNRLYADPVFVMVNPAMIKIKIKSPYKGRSMDKIYAKLAKPSKEQKDFREKNPNRPEFVPVRNEEGKDKPQKDRNEKSDLNNRSGGKNGSAPKDKAEKSDQKEEKIEKPDNKDGRNNGKEKNKGGGKPEKN